MWVVVAVVALVVLIATYVTWTATRVDRLHGRVTAAYSALDAQSLRRAAAAEDLAEREGIVEAQTSAKAVLTGRPDDRPAAENELTRALRLVATKLSSISGEPAALAAVSEESRRLALARQVHSDLVRDAKAIRRRPLVRSLRLTRRHPEPVFFDIDDPTLGTGETL
jgi:hypothetical protein